MKAIHYLKQIKIIDSNIEADTEELVRLETLATKTNSVMGGERVQSSGSQQKMADCVVKMVDMKKKLSEEIDFLISYKEEARGIIFSHCDADTARMLYKRYFMFKTWEQIAVEMDYTYQWVSGGLHQRALSQVQDALNKKKKKEVKK